MQQGRLVFSLNDDGTVTLRCDADAFFSHANEIRRLLTGVEAVDDEESSTSSPHDVEKLRKFWGGVFPTEGAGVPSDLSQGGTEVLAGAYYLTSLRGFEAFSRIDLEGVFLALAKPQPVKTGTLLHLSRRGWLERVRRGYYRLSQRGQDRIASLSAIPSRRRAPRRRVQQPQVPKLTGLSRFLREIPANKKWRRVLLVTYFLHEHCGLEEFDQRLIAACFQKLRGIDPPGSLSALISQVLYKRHGLLERGGARGKYRLSQLALEDLRRNPRVADADAIERARALQTMARTG